MNFINPNVGLQNSIIYILEKNEFENKKWFSYTRTIKLVVKTWLLTYGLIYSIAIIGRTKNCYVDQKLLYRIKYHEWFHGLTFTTFLAEQSGVIQSRSRRCILHLSPHRKSHLWSAIYVAFAFLPIYVVGEKCRGAPELWFPWSQMENEMEQ